MNKFIKTIFCLAATLLLAQTAQAANYYAALSVRLTSNSPSGSGFVLANTSGTGNPTATSSTSTEVTSTSGGAKAFYAIASANDGYDFEGWYSDQAGNNRMSTANPYHVSVNAATKKNNTNTTTIYAKFTAKPTRYAKLQAQVASDSVGLGSVNASASTTAGSYNASSSTVTLQRPGEGNVTGHLFAQASNGYVFVGWSTADGIASYSSVASPYSVDVYANAASAAAAGTTVYYAHFAPPAFRVVSTGEIYGTFEEAYRAAWLTDEIQLVRDATLVNGGAFTVGKNLTLSSDPGHTYTLTRGSAGCSLAVAYNMTLTLSNINVDGANINSSTAMFNVQDGCTLTIENGATIRNCVNASGNGGAVLAQSGARVNLSGGTIKGCEAAQGGAVYLAGTSVMNVSGNPTVVDNTVLDGTRMSNVQPTAANQVKLVGPLSGSVGVNWPTSGTVEGAQFGLVQFGDSAAGFSYDSAAATYHGTISNGTLVWEERPIVAVCRIGETEYISIELAMEAAQPGDTIELLKDIVQNTVLVFDKDVTIDGKGHKVTRGTSGSVFITGDITLRNLTVDGANTVAAGPMITVTSDGSLEMADAVTVTRCSNGGIEASGPVSVAGSTNITGNQNGNLTLTANNLFSVAGSLTGAVSVAYPATVTDGAQFGTVGSYEPTLIDLMNLICENAPAYNAISAGGTLKWTNQNSQFPGGGRTIEQILSDTASSPITYIEIDSSTGDGSDVVIPAGRNVVIDLKGNTLTRNVVANGNVTIIDSSVDKTGKLVGTLAQGTNGSLTIEAGTFTQRPDDDWLAEGRVIVDNANNTYTVVTLAGTSSVNNCTIDTRRGVRLVENPYEDILPFTYASGNWIYGASDDASKSAKVEVVKAEPKLESEMGYAFASKVLWHDGMDDFEEVGVTEGSDKSYDYVSENVNIKQIPDWVELYDGPGESEIEWQKWCWGLIEAKHTNASGTIRAWFKFPEPRFDVTQRDHDHAVQERYWSDTDNSQKGKWEITLSEKWLGDKYEWDRLTGTYDTLEEIKTKLDEFDPNGLRVWENYVLELERTKPLITTASTTNGLVYFDLPGPGKDAQYGYDVRYVLRRVTDSWENVDNDVVVEAKKWKGWAEITERLPHHNFPIPLYPDDHNSATNATGLYHLWTLIIPNTAVAITNQIPSTNIIGVLKVNTACTNMITAVPWKHLSSNPSEATDVTVSEVVDASNLEPGDRLYVYDNASGVYYGYLMEADDTQSEQLGFTKVKWTQMISVDRDGVHTSDAERNTIPRGGTFWTVRQHPVDNNKKIKPYFVVGQHEYGTYTSVIKDGSYDNPASTMVANPTPNSVNLNDLEFIGTISDEDTIMIPNVNGNITTPFIRKNGRWGRNKKTMDSKGRLKTTFVEDCVITPGTGFWYERRSDKVEGDKSLQLIWPTWTEGDYRK